MLFGVQLHGQQFKDNFGLVFTYDFYPVCYLHFSSVSYRRLKKVKLPSMIDYVTS